MSEPNGAQEPPTYYANIVTSNMNVDELTLEFRRFSVPHREFVKAGAADVVSVPPAEPTKIMEEEPLATVVLTFTAAKALKEYLDKIFPAIEEARHQGRTL